jgi:hypothetical protein
VLLYDLLLMGSLAAAELPIELLSAALLANPVDAARVLGVIALEPDLYLLGPAGAYLTSSFSRTGTAALLCLALVVWAVGPMLAAVLKFRLSVRHNPDPVSKTVAEQSMKARLLRRAGSRTSTEEITYS